MDVKSRARRGRQIARLGCCAALCAGALTASAQQGPPPFVNTPPYQLSFAIAPPAGVKITSFDISWVDPVRKRYYLANRTGKDVIVVDTTTNTVVGNFTPGFAGFTGNNNTSGPDGVLTTENELYVGDAPSRVWALDPNTGAPIVSPIVTDPVSQNRADEGCYDPTHKLVAFVNNADNPPFITFISTTDHSVTGRIVFDGQNGRPNATNGAEQCQFNPRDGLIYLSLPEIGGPGDNSAPGGVVVIEPVNRTIVRTMVIPSEACTGPQGLAIGPAVPGPDRGQIGLGCAVSPTAANNAIISDIGNVLASFPGNGGCDEAWYNPGNNKYFVACRQAPGGEALFVIDAAGFGAQRLFTGTNSNAHSVASDPVTFAAYVPTSSAATSGLCSSVPGGAVDANGCILVYTPTRLPSLTAFTATHDFNADSNSDILWQNTTSGQALVWLMHGTSIFQSGSPGTAANPPWTVVGQRDFNGDGNADILWRNSSTGQLVIWLMSGTTVIGGGSPGSVSTAWSVVGTGDFNGDGKGDILWFNNTTGQVVVWFLNGTTVIGGGSPGSVPTGWTVNGVGDFNGDGFSDILWRNSFGQVVIWFMNGSTAIGGGSPGTVTLDWVIAGTGDFNGDHKSDILWRNTNTGQVLIWLLNGATVIGGGSPGSAASPWAIQETGDFNGDARSDILWRNTSTGLVEIWFISNTTVIGGGSPGSLTLDWQIQGLNAD